MVAIVLVGDCDDGDDNHVRTRSSHIQSWSKVDSQDQAGWSQLFWLVIAMMVTMITSEQEAHIFNLGQRSIHKIEQDGPDCFGW